MVVDMLEVNNNMVTAWKYEDDRYHVKVNGEYCCVVAREGRKYVFGDPATSFNSNVTKTSLRAAMKHIGTMWQ